MSSSDERVRLERAFRRAQCEHKRCEQRSRLLQSSMVRGEGEFRRAAGSFQVLQRKLKSLRADKENPKAAFQAGCALARRIEESRAKLCGLKNDMKQMHARRRAAGADLKRAGERTRTVDVLLRHFKQKVSAAKEEHEREEIVTAHRPPALDGGGCRPVEKAGGEASPIMASIHSVPALEVRADVRAAVPAAAKAAPANTNPENRWVESARAWRNGRSSGVELSYVTREGRVAVKIVSAPNRVLRVELIPEVLSQRLYLSGHKKAIVEALEKAGLKVAQVSVSGKRRESAEKEGA